MKDNPCRSRLLTQRLESALRALPVVILTGARQTGKSTLARHVGGGKRKFYTLDDLQVLNRARSSPADFLPKPPLASAQGEDCWRVCAVSALR